MSSCSKTTAVEFRSYELYSTDLKLSASQVMTLNQLTSFSPQDLPKKASATRDIHAKSSTIKIRGPHWPDPGKFSAPHSASFLMLKLISRTNSEASCNKFTEVNSDTNHRGFNRLAPFIIMTLTIKHSYGDAYCISPGRDIPIHTCFGDNHKHCCLSIPVYFTAVQHGKSVVVQCTYTPNFP